VGCQRGKRDIALNLKMPEGLDVAYKLIERADIVHHNMTAGVARKLGIGYDDCKRLNADIVYCNTYAYGFEGPLAHFGGLDPLYQAAAGLEYEAGAVQHGNDPLYYRFGMTDTANAMLSVVGCLAALYHQRRTGEGQELWTSLLDGGAVFASDALLVGGEPVPRPRLDKELRGIDALYRLYETQDGWIQIAAFRDHDFAAICTALKLERLRDDERFTTMRSRHEHQDALAGELEARFRTRTSVSWSLALDDAGVPNEIPLDPKGGEAMLYDADNVELGLTAEYDHPVLGRLRQFGELIGFSETPGRIGGPPPLVGEHTRDIMEWLGYDATEIDELKAAGVVYEPDEHYRERFVL
jgi:crotonobetainyl-CoA:carnitine CoA-transferase CaiB-like acyl-CoA transferase